MVTATHEYTIEELTELVGDRVPGGAIPAVWWITTDEAQIDAYDRWSSDYDAYMDLLKALVKAFGLDEKRPGFVTTFGSRSELLALNPTRGMLYGSDPIPNGWRIDKKTDRLVPSRRTKADRESQANKDFAALRWMPNVRSYLSGLPEEVFIDNGDMTGMYYFINYRRGINCVYAVCNGDPARSERWRSTEVDTNIWHQQKLSRFLALRENAEAKV